jgi:hypothetical protein
MTIPAKIPIMREEGYVTDRIGRYEGGQFMGFVTATLPIPLPEDWQQHKRWYAVLHRFDEDGNHVRTDAWYAGVTADGEDEVIERARERLDRMIESLADHEFCDVEVGLFSVKIDGQTFGLIDASVPEEGYESVHLLPNDLAFFEPWDGSYDT